MRRARRWQRPRHFGREERAAAMVEFAIVAPLLFMLVFGLIDVGRFMFEYHHLVNAVRDGARVGAVLPMTTAAERTASYNTITNHVVSSVSLRPINPNWVSVSEVGTAPTRRVRVSVTGYPFEPTTPFFTRRTTLPSVTAEYRYEFQ
jgi:Flp pilus assembly protein TadG